MREHTGGPSEVGIATFQKLALNALWRAGHLTELQKAGLQEKLKRSEEGRSLLSREGISEKPR